MSAGQERTFIAIKPGAVERGLHFQILQRFEQRGYKLVALKFVTPSKELVESHYAEHKERPFFPIIVDAIADKPVVATVWEGPEIVATARAMIGATSPTVSAPGTIRGDFAITVGKNVIHGSDGVEAANREIALWFKDDELVDWTPRRTPDVISK
jgi:nucleoside-diphosphate kinase